MTSWKDWYQLVTYFRGEDTVGGQSPLTLVSPSVSGVRGVGAPLMCLRECERHYYNQTFSFLKLRMCADESPALAVFLTRRLTSVDKVRLFSQGLGLLICPMAYADHEDVILLAEPSPGLLVRSVQRWNPGLPPPQTWLC